MNETRIEIDGSKPSADIQNPILEETVTTAKNKILDSTYRIIQKSDPDYAAVFTLRMVAEILRDIRPENKDIDFELNKMADLLFEICLKIIAKVEGETNEQGNTDH